MNHLIVLECRKYSIDFNPLMSSVPFLRLSQTVYSQIRRRVKRRLNMVYIDFYSKWNKIEKVQRLEELDKSIPDIPKWTQNDKDRRVH